MRAMHPLMYLGLSLEVVFLALWLGISRTERLEFTVVNLILLAFCAIVPMRVITRPNDTDRLNDCEARAKKADEERDAALAELARLKGEQ
ncbi:hypothetical protein [Deinococcus multiflagellatus]|uniref:DUF4229 domain-containing protein n=1 Tax=Deinococcus multiflagellatus TaxID=1656887 RepID=A0ABW1ZI73_9DEIO